MSTKASSIIGWICVGLVAAFTLFSAVMELIPITDPAVLEYVMRLGVKDIAYPLAAVKFIIVLLYLIPRTSTIGFVLMVGYFGGALATNITHQFPLAEYSPLFIVFVLLTLGAYFRNPELLSRLTRKPYIPE